MVTLLFIIWIVCKIVDYCEEREDEREFRRYENEIANDLNNYDESYNIEIDARQIHFHNHWNDACYLDV